MQHLTHYGFGNCCIDEKKNGEKKNGRNEDKERKEKNSLKSTREIKRRTDKKRKQPQKTTKSRLVIRMKRSMTSNWLTQQELQRLHCGSVLKPQSHWGFHQLTTWTKGCSGLSVIKATISSLSLVNIMSTFMFKSVGFGKSEISDSSQFSQLNV